MILNVNATNKKSGEVISFALEGDKDAGFTYEGTHMQEVTDNKIREVCNIREQARKILWKSFLYKQLFSKLRFR